MDFLGQLGKAMDHLWKTENLQLSGVTLKTYGKPMVFPMENPMENPWPDPQGLPGGAQQELGRSHARGLLRDPLHGGADCHEPRMSVFSRGKAMENLWKISKPMENPMEKEIGPGESSFDEL